MQMILWSLCCYRLFGGVDIKASNLNTQELVQDRNVHSKDIATRILQDEMQTPTLMEPRTART